MRRDIDHRLKAVAEAIPILISRLLAEGYVFSRPGHSFPGVEPEVERHIQQIEEECGRIPYAVTEFWRRVGSIDLRGSNPNWNGCEFPDPLVVYPASVAIEELHQFVDDRDARMKCNFPYVIPVSPDDYHKENVSGAMWYNVNCPAIGDDPPLNDERHKTTFTAYLEVALRWGGFPGLDRCDGHNWPLGKLTKGLPTAR